MSEMAVFDDRVRERDLDHFLVEELHADAALRAWMLANVAHVFEVPDHSTPRVHKSGRRAVDGRQTDVAVDYLAPDGTILASLLIENKITDDLQEGQAESYGAEIAALRTRLGPRRAACILIAPRSNPLSRGNAYFDAAVSVEEVAERLRARLTNSDMHPELRARLDVRIEMLDALCGKRQGSRWVPATLASRRTFADAYVELARQLVPELKVSASTDGPKATTRMFEGFPGQYEMPVKVRLKHEFGNGTDRSKYVNLQFDGAGEAEARFQLEPGLLPADGSMTAVRSGKSLMIRIATPRIVPAPELFESQVDALREGLSGIRRLADWMGVNRDKVRALLREVASEPFRPTQKLHG